MRRALRAVGTYNVYHFGSVCGAKEQGNWIYPPDGTAAEFVCGWQDAIAEYLNDTAVRQSHCTKPGRGTDLEGMH